MILSHTFQYVPKTTTIIIIIIIIIIINLRRLRLVLGTELSAKNKIQAIGSLAVPVIR